MNMNVAASSMVAQRYRSAGLGRSNLQRPNRQRNGQRAGDQHDGVERTHSIGLLVSQLSQTGSRFGLSRPTCLWLLMQVWVGGTLA
ncbi:MAG: hypothetical protein V2A56_09925 [bacterium]